MGTRNGQAESATVGTGPAGTASAAGSSASSPVQPPSPAGARVGPSAPARPLAGRTVVVSGTSSGIGLATAVALSEAGASVHGLSRRAAGGPFLTHRCDVNRYEEVAGAIEGIASGSGIDAVVVAAGTNIPDRYLDRLSVDGWHELVGTNLSGAFHVFHAALTHLRRSRGIAVFISSVSALWPDASGPAYQASKAGLIGLARAAALEEHANGVRVCSVLPGLVDTPLLDRRPVPPSSEQRAAALRPDDVARVCAFLLSLPPHVYIPEMTVLPTELQALGKT
ncbi:MAG: SDR family oxidoreductase [Acidimicrobiales bacterium]